MHLLRIVERLLPTGSEGSKKSVVHDHEMEFPGHGSTALMRKCSTLQQEQSPTGDPDCPEEVKFAKQIKCVIGNKAAVVDTEEGFNLEDGKFGESGANPNAEPSNRSPEEDGVTASTVTPSSTMKKKRACRTATEEREAKKDQFTEMHHLNSLSMQENAEAKRQQRREEQQANFKLVWMICTSLVPMAAAWDPRNKTASAVFRPGQQSVV